jgi:hypothetical protein
MGPQKIFLLFLAIVTSLFCMFFLSCFNPEPPKKNIAPTPQKIPQPAPELTPPSPPPPVEAPDRVSAPTTWMRPLAIIKSGDNPLWFELGTERVGTKGPFQITAPDEASLTPFEPWPLARRITGMVFQEDRLIMGMNREGFLIALPRKDETIALYRIADEAYWGNYTIGSLFLFEGNPAALLYRDDFFVDPVSAPPSPRVFAPLKGNTHPVEIKVPAFAAFLPSEGWDIETLRQGRDGYWYYRGMQRASSQFKRLYFRTSDLSLPGESVSVSAFRNAALPLSLDKAPPLLRLVLDKVFSLSGLDKGNVAAIISPEFSYARSFAEDRSFSGEQEHLVELSGYYLHTGDRGAQALVILPDGRGIFGKAPDNGEDSSLEPITLPSLPEGFIYTRIGLSGKTLIAAWEEQQDVSVGAAGLMILMIGTRDREVSDK